VCARAHACTPFYVRTHKRIWMTFTKQLIWGTHKLSTAAGFGMEKTGPLLVTIHRKANPTDLASKQKHAHTAARADESRHKRQCCTCRDKQAQEAVLHMQTSRHKRRCVPTTSPMSTPTTKTALRTLTHLLSQRHIQMHTNAPHVSNKKGMHIHTCPQRHTPALRI